MALASPFDPAARALITDVFVLPLEGASRDAIKPRPFLQTPFDESQAAFSPDGHCVAYQSNERKPFEVYVQPFPGPGGKQQISTAGGASPRWRRDGRELFYLAPDGRLMGAAIRIQGSTLEADSPVVLFHTGLTTPFSGTAGNIRPQYDVSVDGRFLMNITTEQASAPITMILNWKPPVR